MSSACILEELQNFARLFVYSDQEAFEVRLQELVVGQLVEPSGIHLGLLID